MIAVCLFLGPVPLVATNSSPPLALGVGVGVGVGMPVPHMLQQLLDESGTVRHVILSPQPALVNMGPHYVSIMARFFVTLCWQYRFTHLLTVLLIA